MHTSQDKELAYLIMHLTSWALVWREATHYTGLGFGVDRNVWRNMRVFAEHRMRELEEKIAQRLPSGYYHHERTERRP